MDAATGQPVLRKHNCAIRAVAERYPEVCATEQAFINELLGETAERRSHILGGCNACEYVVVPRLARPGSGGGMIVAGSPGNSETPDGVEIA
jgi:predicted ArsR family transcriptional regulator